MGNFFSGVGVHMDLDFGEATQNIKETASNVTAELGKMTGVLSTNLDTATKEFTRLGNHLVGNATAISHRFADLGDKFAENGLKVEIKVDPGINAIIISGMFLATLVGIVFVCLLFQRRRGNTEQKINIL